MLPVLKVSSISIAAPRFGLSNFLLLLAHSIAHKTFPANAGADSDVVLWPQLCDFHRILVLHDFAAFYSRRISLLDSAHDC